MVTATFGYSDKRLPIERLLDNGGYDKRLRWSVNEALECLYKNRTTLKMSIKANTIVMNSLVVIVGGRGKVRLSNLIRFAFFLGGDSHWPICCTPTVFRLPPKRLGKMEETVPCDRLMEYLCESLRSGQLEVNGEASSFIAEVLWQHVAKYRVRRLPHCTNDGPQPEDNYSITISWTAVRENFDALEVDNNKILGLDVKV